MTDARDSPLTTPDRWLALTVDSISPLASELLVERLLGLGARGVQEVGGRLITHVPAPDDPEAFVSRVQDGLREATGLEDVPLSWHLQDHEDWSVLWRQGLAPRMITERLMVTPSWCSADPPKGVVVVTIDPGMAFGTAEHATTRGSLRLMDRALTPGQRLLDAGCGSGILAICAARLGALDVLAVDVDPYACEAARENADLNGVAMTVGVEEASVKSDWLLERGPFDGVLANIQPIVLVPLLQRFAEVLSPGGWLILSGITAQEWQEVSLCATEVGLHLEDVDEEGEWRSGWFKLRAG